MPCVSVPDRQIRLAIAARAFCDPRVVARYYSPALPMAMVSEGNIRRALSELRMPDPRALKGGRP